MDFDSIYTAYFKDVFMYLRSLSANADIAEEITQETFEKALKSIDRFDGKKDIDLPKEELDTENYDKNKCFFK